MIKPFRLFTSSGPLGAPPWVSCVLPEESPLLTGVVGQHEVPLHPGREVELEEAPQRRVRCAHAAPGDSKCPAMQQHGAFGHLDDAALRDGEQLHLVARPLKLHLGRAQVLEVQHEDAVPVAPVVPQRPHGREVVEVDVPQLPAKSSIANLYK